MSQDTNDRDDEYDDSRGSINVIYLRKLKELEDQVKEKQWSIERLEKHNFQLERQVEKWEQMEVKYNGQERRNVVYKEAHKIHEELLTSGELSFRKNPALDPNVHNSSSLKQ